MAIAKVIVREDAPMASWLDDIVDSFEAIGGSGTLSDVYSELESRRPDRPPSWQSGVRRMIQDHSSDSAGFKGGVDLFFSVEGLGQGVWGLRALVEPTPVAVDLDAGEASPGRAVQTVYRILRDTKLARQVKLLHRDECQICGEALRLSGERTYSEAHHIVPVGSDHNGPDTPENIIVLCPNHHALCDYGAIALDRARLRRIAGHSVSDESIRYHNEHIYQQRFGRLET